MTRLPVRVRSTSFIATVVLFVTVAAIALIRVQKFYGKPPRPKTAEQAYKNIQVLKGIPAEEVYTTMQSFSSALGVTCQYCHVSTTYYKDDKPSKQTARRMLVLQMTINRDQFNGQMRITCYSCHRGSLQVPAEE